ncbi:MAG: PEP-CTERM sorting domain-containing protein [Crocosphaera sp.]|nr:PEP-CTERM sorting domain-containing protein [Crocosphaera sp.]
MTNLFNKFALMSASTFLCLTVPVHAASITYNFEVSIDSGSLAGETYTGSFIFDDSGLTGIGDEFLSVSRISFDFDGVNYTETDDSFGPEVLFFDGDFLGLSFSTDAEFSLIPGFFELEEALFSYNLPGQVDGAGDVNYNLVPEPLTILGTVTALGLGGFFKRKLKLSNKSQRN